MGPDGPLHRQTSRPMTASPTTRVRLALVLTIAGLASGCACHGHQRGWCAHHGGQFFSGYVPSCFGYSSTCWHQWPAECVTCPTPFGPETMESLPGKHLPPAAIEPAPLEAPVPMPSDQEPSLPPAVPAEPPAFSPPPPAPAIVPSPAPPRVPAPAFEEETSYAPPPPVLTEAPIVTPASVRASRRLTNGPQ